MTILDAVDEAIEALDELTTPSEVMPNLAGHVDPDDDTTCHDCEPPRVFNSKAALAGHSWTHRARNAVESAKGTGTKKSTGAKKAAGAKKAPTSRSTKKPTKPSEGAKPPPRLSGVEMIGDLVDGAGVLLTERNIDVPVGRLLQLEAPLLAPELDKAIAGHFVDRHLLQPAIRTEARWRVVGELLEAPILVLLAERVPEMRDIVYPRLHKNLRRQLPALVKRYKEMADEQAEVDEAVEELSQLSPDMARIFAGGVDPVDMLIRSLFNAAAPDDAPEEGTP